MIWKEFWRLKVIDFANDYIGPSWTRAKRVRCKCSCGNQKDINISSLKRWMTKSCWCLFIERSKRGRIQKKEYKQTSSQKGLWVYIIKCVWHYTKNYYKIWVTTNDWLDKRLSILQVWNPFKIDLLYFVEASDAYAIEKKLHNINAKYKMQWEWFDLKKPMVDKAYKKLIALANGKDFYYQL